MAYPIENQVLTLQFPVTVNNKEYTALEFRRPKVRDNLIADKQNEADADKEIALMALLSGVDQNVIHELDMADYAAGQQIIMGFQKRDSGSTEKVSTKVS
ncbi:phage tail assembly protein [Celerinatantimonas sp. MCCC 1A17872]|uniref:phage tail assembly protein n=1 Tax=Celerinatantimonas sp. MCCC 1A17872 TaxID=3177514 RepID=UPI0038C3EF2F